MQCMHSQKNSQMESVCSEGLVHNFGFNTEDRPDPFKPISLCMLGAESLDLFLDLSFYSTCTLGIFTDLCNLKNNLDLFPSTPV